MEYILTAESLGKQYRHFKALDSFSIHVPKGSIYGFVGKTARERQLSSASYAGCRSLHPAAIHYTG